MTKKEIVLQELSDTPVKQNELIERLKDKGLSFSTARELRKVLRQINVDFISGDIEFGVVSNSKGSYKTTDEEAIRKFNDNKIKHAKSELWSAYNMNKQINNNKNLSFEDYLKMEFESYGSEMD